jgi:hypothetical protein
MKGTGIRIDTSALAGIGSSATSFGEGDARSFRTQLISCAGGATAAAVQGIRPEIDATAPAGRQQPLARTRT